MKAILINPATKTISEVEVTSKNGSQLDSIYAHLECDTFTTGANLNRGDTLYVDDNGLFRERHEIIKSGVFRIQGQVQPLVGNGLIMGIDGEGESQDVRNTLEQIKEIVSWSTIQELEHVLRCSLPLQ